MNTRSRYFGHTAQQIAADYFAWLFKARVVAIATAVACGLAAVMLVLSGETFGFIACLIAAVVSAWAFKARVSSRFRGLLDILGADCDAEKYREVIELIAQRDKRQRSKGVCLTELALAHYHANRPMDALQLLSQASFESSKSILWVRTYNVEAIARNAAGDIAGRDAALERIASFRAGTSIGSVKRAAIDDVLLGLNVQFRPAEQQGPADLDCMRRNAATADSRLTWVSWTLCEAEYHLAHGDVQTASSLVAKVAEGPVTPRAAANMERLRGLFL